MSRRLAPGLVWLLLLAGAGLAPAEPGRTLEVVDADGRPLEGARLVLLRERIEGRWVLEATAPALSTSDASGRLVLPVVEGEAALHVVAAGWLPQPVPGAAGPGPLRLRRARTLEGLVRWSGGRAAAGASVVLLPLSEGSGVALALTLDPLGRLRSELAGPGSHRLLLRRSDGLLLPLATLGEAGSPAPTLLRLPGGLDGRLLDARQSGDVGAPHLRLRLVPLPRRPEGAALEARTDDRGRFLIAEAAPGAYELELLDPGWCFDQPTARVDVPAAGLVREASWFVARRARVDGRVLAPGDAPVRGAQVRLLPDPRQEPWPSRPAGPPPEAFTDAAGAYALEGVVPGVGLRLHVEAQGFAPWLSEPFEVSGSGSTSLRPARLSAGWALEVEVRDARGRPLPGARASASAALLPGAGARTEVAGGGAGPFERVGTTDEAGRARLGGLPEGDALLRVTAPGLLAVERVVGEPPGGGTARERVLLEPAPGLGGRLSRSDGAPAPDLELVARPTEGEGDGAERRTRSAADGRFRFEGLSREPHDVEVRAASGRRLLRVVGHVPGEGPLDLLLPDLAGLAGTVDGLAAAGGAAEVWLEAEEEAGADALPRRRVVERVGLPPGAGAAPFAFAGLAPGPYAVRVVQGARQSEPLPVVAEGAGRADLSLSLPEPASLAGAVLDARGAPLAGIELRLTRLSGPAEAPLEGPPPLRCVTDGRGAYLVEGLGAGLWRVEVRQPGAGADAEVLRVVPGAAVVARDLLLAAGGALEGEVRDALGRPIDGAEVALTPLLGPGAPAVGRTDAQGRYLLEGLLAGTYRAEVRAPARLPGPRAAVVAVSPGARETLDFVPSGRGRIEGLVSRGAQRAAGAVVRLRSEPGEGAGLERVERARADGEGAFAFDGLAAGRYRLLLSDGATRTGGEVVLEEGERVRVDLELFEARLSGIVLGADGRGVPGAEVLARPNRAVVGVLDAQGRTDPEGRFVLGGLPVGRYDLEVRAPGRPPGRLLAAQADLPGADHPVSVVLTTGATVDVEVRGPDGRPVGGARLSVDLLGAEVEARVTALTGPSGRVRLEGVPGGRVEVEAYARDVGRAYGALEAVDGAAAALLLRLEPPGALEVTLSGVPAEALPRAVLEVLRVGHAAPVALGRFSPPTGVPLEAVSAPLRLFDLAPGEYVLRVSAGARQGTTRVPATVRAREVTRVSLSPQR